MSFSVLLFKNFYKNPKSTRIPDIADKDKDKFINVEVSLKNETDLLNPSFLLSSNIMGDLEINSHLYSYVYWQEFGRYYFVENITQVSNTLYRLDCSVDVLGTYRRQILASSQFVVYAEKDVDNDIADTRLVPSTTPLILSTTGNDIFPNTNSCVLVNVISQNASASKLSGGISQYIFDTQEDFTNFLQKSFHMYENVELELCLRLYMTGTTPDSILSANYLPYTPSDTLKTNAYIGAYDTGVAVKYATNPTEVVYQSLKIPWFDNDKRFRCATYYKASLYLPFIGCIGIDIADISKIDNIGITYVFDNVNGSYLCTVTYDSQIQHIFQGSVSSSIQFSTITNNPIQGYIDIASGAGKLLKGNVGDALSGVIDGIGEFTRADTTVIGDYNTRISTQYLSIRPSIRLFYYQPNAKGIEKVRGNVLCHTSILNNYVGGYIQTENAHFEYSNNSMLKSESDKICEMIDNGIFLE